MSVIVHLSRRGLRGRVLRSLGDIVMAPSFPRRELATRKGEVITAIRQDEDNPAVRAVEALMALLYGAEHPYGRRTKGNDRDRRGADRASGFGRCTRERFAPAELTAVVVGDVEAGACGRCRRTGLRRWRAPRAARRLRCRSPVVAGDAPAARRPDDEQGAGGHRVRVHRRSARADPGYYALWLMNNVLGQYALGGRLGDSIRERQGMAYYVSSILDANVIAGPLLIRAGVSPANVDRADRVDRRGAGAVCARRTDREGAATSRASF